jgi:hypothetical protein
VITPRATASGPTRGKGNRTRTRTCDSRAGVGSMTGAGPAREEGVRSSIYSGNIIHDLSSYRPAHPPDLVGFERIHATEARPTWSRDVPCQLMNTRTIQGISTPPIHQYSATPIQTKNCTNQLKILRTDSSQKIKVASKLVTTLRGSA